MSLPVPTSSEGLKNSREREGERGGWNQKYNDDGEARAFFPFLSVSIFLSHFLSLWLLFYYALSRVEHQLTGRCCPVERLPRVRGGVGWGVVGCGRGAGGGGGGGYPSARCMLCQRPVSASSLPACESALSLSLSLPLSLCLSLSASLSLCFSFQTAEGFI